MAVGKSALISAIDASDTFTTGLRGDYRATPYTASWEVATALELDGKRSLSWEIPVADMWALTSTKSSSLGAYPGETEAGSVTGITENGQVDVAWGIPYGIRDNFVMQFDAVVPTDRVTMIFGPGALKGAAGVLESNTLSLFIRTADSTLPNVGIFHSNTLQEIDTGLSSTLLESGRWHNFAAKVDVVKRTIEIFIDDVSLGIVDVDALAPDFSWDASAVGYGLRSPERAIQWSDNFQIGSPVSTENQ